MNAGDFELGLLRNGLAHRDRVRRFCAALVLGALLALLLVMSSGGPSWLSCPFHEYTGYSCLTCGMTRSLDAMGRGDLIGALQHHAFGPMLLAGMTLCCAGLLSEALSGRKILLPIARAGGRAGVVVLGLLWLLYGIARLAVELIA